MQNANENGKIFGTEATKEFYFLNKGILGKPREVLIYLNAVISVILAGLY